MNKKYKNLILDMNNLYWRAVTVNTPEIIVYNKKKFDISGIKKSLQMIEKLKRNYLSEDGRVWYLWDNPTSKMNLRKEINPEYKCDRESLSQSFYRGMDYLSLLIKSGSDNGFEVKAKNLEADDLVKPILEKIGGTQTSLLVSTDLDWARPISETVDWLTKDELFNLSSFESTFGFKPTIASICFYKTFYGDKVDSISALLREFPKSYFLNIAGSCETIYELLHKTKEGELEYLDEGWRERILRDADKLISNWQLVDFLPVSEKELEVWIHPCAYEPTKTTILKTALGLGESTKKTNKKVNLATQFSKPEKVERKGYR